MIQQPDNLSNDKAVLDALENPPTLRELIAELDDDARARIENRLDSLEIDTRLAVESGINAQFDMAAVMLKLLIQNPSPYLDQNQDGWQLLWTDAAAEIDARRNESGLLDDERAAADAAADAEAKRIDTLRGRIGILDIGSEQHEVAFTPQGIAFEILRQAGDRVLVVKEREDSLVSTDALLMHSGGTWAASDKPLQPILDNMAQDYLWAMRQIRAAIPPDTSDNKAARAAIKSAIRDWRRELKGAYPARQDSPGGTLRGSFDAAMRNLGSAIAYKQPRVCTEAQLDGDMALLGAPNGIVDLRTLEHYSDPDEAADLLVTGMLRDPIDLEAQSPITDTLFAHLDTATREYLLASLAWALRGSPNRTFLLLLGAPGGGKTALMNALQAALGVTYAATVDEDAFTRKRGNQAGLSPSAASLVKPGRLALVREAGKATYDRERLKMLSGDEDLTWRKPYGQLRTDPVTATILMAANEYPAIDGTDAALMDRMRVLHYPPVPADTRKPHMVRAFEGHSSEAQRARQALIAMILRAGWQATAPPQPPQIVLEATREAKRMLIGDAGLWLADNVKRAPATARLSTEQLWNAVCRAHGKDSGQDKVAGGLSRRQAVRFVSGKFGLTKNMRIGGTVKSGWHGIALADGATGGMTAAEADMLGGAFESEALI